MAPPPTGACPGSKLRQTVFWLPREHHVISAHVMTQAQQPPLHNQHGMAPVACRYQNNATMHRVLLRVAEALTLCIISDTHRCTIRHCNRDLCASSGRLCILCCPPADQHCGIHTSGTRNALVRVLGTSNFRHAMLLVRQKAPQAGWMHSPGAAAPVLCCHVLFERGLPLPLHPPPPLQDCNVLCEKGSRPSSNSAGHQAAAAQQTAPRPQPPSRCPFCPSAPRAVTAPVVQRPWLPLLTA